MKENLKTFSDDVAKALKAKIESSEFASFIANTKSAGDDRSFEVVMSTSDEDRQGDELDQSKWDLKYFNLNPVVLWAHNYSGFPIGIVTDIKIEGDKAIATGKFAPEGINPEADLACKLYQEKILRTVSPGYIQNDDGTRELLELSFCSVPAGRFALTMRQVGAIGYSTPELIAKGFFYKNQDPPTKKADEHLGDTCEMEDGGAGVLAKDPENPDQLVCVPTEDKSAKPNETKENMKNELEKHLKAEHERHGEAVGKAVDEFTEKCMKSEKSVLDKAIEDYTKAMDAEQPDHLEKCMKAIDDNYELQDQTPKKAIDEFKSEMTDEHLKHVKACDKAIDEFKAEPGYSEDEKKKAIDEFTKAMSDELDRHQKAHMDMVKAEEMGEEDGKSEKKAKGVVADTLEQSAEYRTKSQRTNDVMTIMNAFCYAYYDAPLESFSELIGEAMQLIKDYVTEEAGDDEEFDAKALKGVMSAALVKAKAGRAISAANKKKLDAIVKMIEDGHTEHGKAVEQVTAALKSIMDSGDGGEETKPEEKSGEAPEIKVEHLGSKTDLETYLFTQRLVRQVKTASEGALRQINNKIREARSGS